MKTIIKTLGVIAIVASLSGCIIGPGGGHHHHGHGWGHHHGHGGHHRGW